MKWGDTLAVMVGGSIMAYGLTGEMIRHHHNKPPQFIEESQLVWKLQHITAPMVEQQRSQWYFHTDEYRQKIQSTNIRDVCEGAERIISNEFQEAMYVAGYQFSPGAGAWFAPKNRTINPEAEAKARRLDSLWKKVHEDCESHQR